MDIATPVVNSIWFITRKRNIEDLGWLITKWLTSIMTIQVAQYTGNKFHTNCKALIMRSIQLVVIPSKIYEANNKLPITLQNILKINCNFWMLQRINEPYREDHINPYKHSTNNFLLCWSFPFFLWKERNYFFHLYL